MSGTPEVLAAEDEALAAWLPLARLVCGEQAAWCAPMARLLAAAGRGVGHLPVAEVLGDTSEHPPSHLIAIEDERAMLPRQAAAWRVIRSHVESPPGGETGFDDHAIASALDRILPAETANDAAGRVVFDNVYQRLAVAGLIDAPCGVLTGGPGSGKTTTAAALLALRIHLEPGLEPEDLVVCAPTGKAANRLQRSLRRALERLDLRDEERALLAALRPRTIHRVLEWTPVPSEDGGPWRHHARRPLRARLVVVDEASMADTELMAALIDALPRDCALVLIGDRDQLDSVEAGGVLAELVQRGACGELDPTRTARLGARIGRDASGIWRRGLPHAEAHHATALPGLAFGLAASFRAKDAPWILELAELVRPGGGGDTAALTACCARHDADRLEHTADRSVFERRCDAGWSALREAIAHWRSESPPTADALQDALDAFQVLAVSNHQVEAANRRALARSTGRAPRTGEPLPHGTPIMVLANDHALDLANGDLGIAIGDAPDDVARLACFPGRDRPLPLARLPRHLPAFAITIHKSQGSEWQRVAIDLTAERGDLLDRNLLYTAITRAAQAVSLYADAALLAAVLARP